MATVPIDTIPLAKILHVVCTEGEFSVSAGTFAETPNGYFFKGPGGKGHFVPAAALVCVRE
jgi:hypothetical protein